MSQNEIEFFVKLLDFGEEAAQLQRRTFLDLRNYCRKKFGLDFHAIDTQRLMTSSVAADVTHDKIRMLVQLIANTQNASAGPNFVVSK